MDEIIIAISIEINSDQVRGPSLIVRYALMIVEKAVELLTERSIERLDVAF